MFVARVHLMLSAARKLSPNNPEITHAHASKQQIVIFLIYV